MKIAIGCDHAGPELKAEILAHLDEKGVEYTDFGIQAGEKVDYPGKGSLRESGFGRIRNGNTHMRNWYWNVNERKQDKGNKSGLLFGLFLC